MQKRIGILLLAAAVLLSGGAALADDGFYVIAGGGGTVGTKITSLPCTIENPGFYYLGRNLTYSGEGNAITIGADNVTLDLMGCGLTYNGADGQANGIYMNARKNVEIRNGTVSGFWNGVCESSPSGANHRIMNLRADYNTASDGIGIWLNGNNHLVRDCTASHNIYAGILVTSGTVTGCVASNNSTGIQLDGPGSLLENIAFNNTLGFWIGMSEIILVESNSAGGNVSNYIGSGFNTVWGVNAGR